MTPVIVTEVSVAPDSVTTAEGGRVEYTATVRDENDEAYGDAPVEWSSDDPSVITIDEDGIARAVSPGSTRIFATFHDVRGEAIVTVIESGGGGGGGGGSGDEPCVDIGPLPGVCLKP